MRKAIVDDALEKSGKGPRRAELSSSIDRAVAAGAPLFEALLAVGVPGDVVIAVAAAHSGLPAAPRLLLMNPQVPDALDATGVRDSGGVPLGIVQGRLWIAFADADDARAAVFSDDVVVCLAVDDDLAAARAAFDDLHPPDDGASTLSIAAVTPEGAAAWQKKQRATSSAANWDDATAQVAPLARGSSTQLAPSSSAEAGRAVGRGAAPGGARSTALQPPTALGPPPGGDSEEDLFDGPSGATNPSQLASRSASAERASTDSDEDVDPSAQTRVQKAPTANDTALASSANSSNPSNPSASPSSASPLSALSAASASSAETPDAERLRLLRLAQLGRLRQFTFVRPLGSGAMATVYLATQKSSGKSVAVKVLEPHLVNDPLALGRFRREMNALRSLDHPHITSTLDGGDGDAEAPLTATSTGVCWLCCPYLDGGTLAALAHRTGAMPVAMALPIVAALLDAVGHAHERGVLHRDLKPQNVLLSAAGDVQVSDFGMARVVGDVPLTRAGARYGTPAYMAPEQTRGDDVDERADLFAIGVILVELITGRHPFARPTPQETLAAVATADVDALDSGVAVVDDVAAWLLARDRSSRAGSAAAVLERLRPLLDTLPAVEAVVARALHDPRGAVVELAAEPGAALDNGPSDDLDQIPPTAHDDDGSLTAAAEHTVPRVVAAPLSSSSGSLNPNTITNMAIPVLPLPFDSVAPVPVAAPSTMSAVGAALRGPQRNVIAVVVGVTLAVLAVVLAVVLL